MRWRVCTPGSPKRRSVERSRNSAGRADRRRSATRSPCPLTGTVRPRALRRPALDAVGSLVGLGPEGVFDAHAVVVLPVAQVVGEHDVAPEGAGSFDDCGVPIGDAEALARAR